MWVFYFYNRLALPDSVGNSRMKGSMMDLTTFFAENKQVALAFSGGVDSSYLLYEAMRCGCDVHAFFIKTAFQPQFELDDATRLAAQLNARITILPDDVFSREEIIANPPDRCYHCKTALFTRIKNAAIAAGYTVLIDGTNASDDCDDRPGMRALKELSVRSPLRECGITKVQVRALSKAAGLFTHNKPAYACLATRIPTGMRIAPDTLQKVEQAEAALYTMGFRDLRVRIAGKGAKLQLPAEQFIKAAELRAEIHDKLSPLFAELWLDLTPRGQE